MPTRLTCLAQEICQHYSNGSKRKGHHIRLVDPCKHWLADDCKVMLQWNDIRYYCDPKPMACKRKK